MSICSRNEAQHETSPLYSAPKSLQLRRKRLALATSIQCYSWLTSKREKSESSLVPEQSISSPTVLRLETNLDDTFQAFFPANSCNTAAPEERETDMMERWIYRYCEQ